MGITYGSFSGAVTDQGSPVAGAIVQALSGGLVTGTAVTDGNGQYTLWVPAGSGYALQASQIGRSTTAISSFTASAGASTFVNLNLPSLNGAIAGAVADTNGSPVSGAQVSVTSAVFTGSAIANAAGAYSVPSPARKLLGHRHRRRVFERDALRGDCLRRQYDDGEFPVDAAAGCRADL